MRPNQNVKLQIPVSPIQPVDKSFQILYFWFEIGISLCCLREENFDGELDLPMKEAWRKDIFQVFLWKGAYYEGEIMSQFYYFTFTIRLHGLENPQQIMCNETNFPKMCCDSMITCGQILLNLQKWPMPWLLLKFWILIIFTLVIMWKNINYKIIKEEKIK